MSEYQLTERIGAGGMGDVYRASEIMPNGKRLPVACKILNGVLRRERELIEAFQKEAEGTFVSGGKSASITRDWSRCTTGSAPGQTVRTTMPSRFLCARPLRASLLSA